MAKPYLDGKGWAVRMRIKGQDIYLSGFATEAAAKRAAAEKRQALASVGQALQGYGRERLAHMKGGKARCCPHQSLSLPRTRITASWRIADARFDQGERGVISSYLTTT